MGEAPPVDWGSRLRLRPTRRVPPGGRHRDDRSTSQRATEGADPRRAEARRYKKRWKVERLFAWLGNFRRLVVRYERRVENYLGFVRLACMVILLRYL
jgi:transposase